MLVGVRLFLFKESPPDIWLSAAHFTFASVDVALCFDWIDSKKIKVDEETSHQFFSKRKPQSIWSNQQRKSSVAIDKGLMTQTGFEVIEIAKQNATLENY